MTIATMITIDEATVYEITLVKKSSDKILFRVVLFFLSWSLLPGAIHAQIQIGVDANYLTPTQSFYYNDKTNMTSANYSVTRSAKRISLGTGINFGIHGAYLIKGVFGPELGVNYQESNNYVSKYDMTFFSSESVHATSELSATSLQGFVGARYQSKYVLIKKIQPFASAGLLLGIGTRHKEVYHEEHYMNPGPGPATTSIIEQQLDYTGGTAYGIYFRSGFVFPINNRLLLQAHFSYNGLSWAPQRAKYSRYVVDGVDQLPFMDKQDKEVEFVESYDTSQHSPDKPDQTLKFNLPYSGLGGGIRVIMVLGGADN